MFSACITQTVWCRCAVEGGLGTGCFWWAACLDVMSYEQNQRASLLALGSWVACSGAQAFVALGGFHVDRRRSDSRCCFTPSTGKESKRSLRSVLAMFITFYQILLTKHSVFIMVLDVICRVYQLGLETGLVNLHVNQAKSVMCLFLLQNKTSPEKISSQTP